jgi:hypothetical protein
MKRDELTIETISPALELKIAGTPTNEHDKTDVSEIKPPEVNSMATVRTLWWFQRGSAVSPPRH